MSHQCLFPIYIKDINGSKHSPRGTQNIKTVDRKLKIGVNHNFLQII